MYAPHQPPLPLPGTGRGFASVSPRGIRGCLAARSGPRNARSALGLAWDLRLVHIVGFLWTGGPCVVPFCLSELVQRFVHRLGGGSSRSPRPHLFSSESTVPGPRATAHPCIVASEFTRDQVDPRIAEVWAALGKKPKFGDMRTIWRRRHCRTLNPYDSKHCAYTPEECALAYLQCATRAAEMSRSNPMGYFWKSALSTALVRADDKPLARTQGSGDPGTPGAGSASRPAAVAARPTTPGPDSDHPGLRRDISVPQHIGTLLGSLDLGPHQGRTPDGEEGTE